MRKPRVDYIFLFACLALTAIGSIMIFSASPTMALKLGDSYYFLKRHIFYLLLGFSALYFGLRLDLRILKKWAALILGLSIVLLLLVYIPGVGKNISGASRWINLLGFSFQPSELIKFTMILFLAGWLSKAGKKIEDFFLGLLPPLILVGAVCALIISQPDLGTAIAIAGTAFIMFFIAGAKSLHLALLGLVGISGVIGLSLTSPYRLRRIVAFIDPWKDPQGTGFHIVQSLLAVGSGGLFGLGLGASKQKFFYLPQQFTDFIFAILCEEMGFLGGAVVVVLFLIMAGRGFRIAYKARDRFSFLLATGLVSWLTLQALINIMVVLGMLPTTGIPLPFISYGGTATIVGLFSVGILLNISLTEVQAK
ncbi:MAG: putative lipid II flippase FtsW [Candidatus Margulisbacteria bacterium]|nr:putative lipid II flippase FtsW [Candidatus Margulisiibacteriota bacterium]